ncbi:MAG TPA: phosphatase PAP2 family protein [Thermoanaerobaculia bacterium]|nr:phosphatase PAP2 family protein [Thermoanaerobaculia bacterium]
MQTARAQGAMDRLVALDLAACRALQHRTGEWMQAAFALVSRLGDGWLWGTVAVALLLAGGSDAVPTILGMLVAAVAGLPLYVLLKRWMARPRPCATAGSGLRPLVPALDRFSFPSGHTLHAVAFTVVVLGRYPGLAWLLVPFTALVALSRVVLGLHYPSDVMAGAAIGSLLGSLPRMLEAALAAIFAA